MGSFGANNSSFSVAKYFATKCKVQRWHMIIEVASKDPQRYPSIDLGPEGELEAMTNCSCPDCSTLFKCVKCQGAISLVSFSHQEKNNAPHFCRLCSEKFIEEQFGIRNAENN